MAKGGIKVYANRHARTWLHNLGWSDEIPSISENNNMPSQSRKCTTCDGETFGPQHDKCIHHMYYDERGRYLGRFADNMRDYFKRHDLHKLTTEQVRAKLKKILVARK